MSENLIEFNNISKFFGKVIALKDGNIINTNAQWISEQLSQLGLNHFRQSTIGDNFSRAAVFKAVDKGSGGTYNRIPTLS